MTAKIFSDAERDQVNAAVRAAEAKTSAELVPVVARSSGRYDRAEDIVGLWIGGAALIAVWAFYPLPQTQSGDWGAAHPIWQLVAMLVGGLLGFVLGAILATRVTWLRRLFTASSQMEEEVMGRARQMFFDNRVHHTGGGSGLLLYVSLFEHRAAVIADQSVLEKLGQDSVDEICQEFTARLHEKGPVDALCETITAVGDRLSPLLPRAEDDVNELPDELVVIE